MLSADMGSHDASGPNEDSATEMGWNPALSSCIDTAADDDGDGIPNISEGDGGCDDDSDGDGVDDYLDADDDNNGILTRNMGTEKINRKSDLDKDGIPDYRDTDDDGDGIIDMVEIHALRDRCTMSDFGVPATAPISSYHTYFDEDGDGTLESLPLIRTLPINYRNPDDDRDTVPTASEYVGCRDTDSDSIPNFLDKDDDGDSISTDIEMAYETVDTDRDGDGIENYLDLDSDDDGVADKDEGKPDTDGDGWPNYLDFDSDGDALLDSFENVYPSVDADSIPNYLDTDSDDDGISDKSEGTLNTDGDAFPNFVDLDSDGDTILDSVEGTEDPDNDGKPNYIDSDSENDGVPDSTEAGLNTDGDAVLDYLDIDDDADGIPTSLEFSETGDGDSIPSYLDEDSDNDGVPDVVEAWDDDNTGEANTKPRGADTNGDGLDDAFCLLSPRGEAYLIYTPKDRDGDGTANPFDPDDDGDGIPTLGEDHDDDSDPTTDDSDGDDTPDYLDPDDDDDGVPTLVENLYDVDPLVADSDKDGLSDLQEWNYYAFIEGTHLEWMNPEDFPEPRMYSAEGGTIPDVLNPDDDGDGIPTIIEGTGDIDGAPPMPGDCSGWMDETCAEAPDGIPNHLDLDSDGDGIPDAEENYLLDNDRDGSTDAFDCDDCDGVGWDSDGDGLLNGIEDALGSSRFNVDSDGDGIGDFFECEPNGETYVSPDRDEDGIYAINDPDDDGDGVGTAFETPDPDGNLDPADAQDSDDDGLPDYLDDDDDGDGLPTREEIGSDERDDGDLDPDRALDVDGDALPDYLDIDLTDGPLGDADGDGINNITEEELGLNPALTDSDGDSVPDNLELDLIDGVWTAKDSDEDGTLDALDEDDDGDGLPTLRENQVLGLEQCDGDTRSLDENRNGDADDDGIPNYLDLNSDCPDDSGASCDGTDASEGDGDDDEDGIPNFTDCIATPISRTVTWGCQTSPTPNLPWLLAFPLLIALRRRRHE